VKIPEDAGARQLLYQELVRNCLSSRQDRFDFYKMLRNYYLFGSAGSEGATYNKIASTVDTLASFIYSPASTRFAIHLGVTAPDGEIHKVPPMKAEISDQWKQTNARTAVSANIHSKGPYPRSGVQSHEPAIGAAALDITTGADSAPLMEPY